MNAGCAGKTEIPWERVPYLSALEACSRRGAIQVHVYLTLPYLTSNFECQICHRMCRSRIGLLAHNKSHSWWWNPSYRRLSPWVYSS